MLTAHYQVTTPYTPYSGYTKQGIPIQKFKRLLDPDTYIGMGVVTLIHVDMRTG